MYTYAVIALQVGVCALPLLAADAGTSKPVPVIYDTDMGNDIDDALALAVLHSLESSGEARLLGVTITKDNTWSAPCVDAYNTFYGRPDVPIGVVRKGKTPKDSKYTKTTATRRVDGKSVYPHDLTRGEDAPEAVSVLRKLLAEHPDDKSVVFVVVGFSTNISRLLDSKPDAVSRLDGRALVAKKARLLSIMAGAYGGPRKPEYNVRVDIPAARNVYAKWPTPIVASGYEIGTAIRYPAKSIMNDFGYVKNHPIKEGYELYMKMPYDRQCWDLTSALYAVRPDRGYFGLSSAGRITVNDDGRTEFTKDAAGLHRYLTVTPEQITRVREALVKLVTQPPAKK